MKSSQQLTLPLLRISLVYWSHDIQMNSSVVITRTISLRTRLQPVGVGIHTYTLPI